MAAVDPPTSLERHLDLSGDAGVSELLIRSSRLRPLCCTSSPASDDEVTDGAGGSSEGRWVLWHEFMEEHARLDAWLRLAEEAVASSESTDVCYRDAKVELTKLQRLRWEAGPRLVQLDQLARRNRTLTRLFRGAVRARLLTAARDCGRRWDHVHARLASITTRLQLLVSEWEEFEAQREEFAQWLSDVDVSLTEVDHRRGSTREKLQRLQSFQQCVCVTSSRVSALLWRGETLIQRSAPGDAEQVEHHLLELLRHCTHVHNNIARMHTRLLSMRLVFEDDWILSPVPDSGCPSETLLESEGALEMLHLDLPAASKPPQNSTPWLNSAFSSPPPRPPSSPTHEHLGLEWDPSVDIGRSVSHDDADSSYFSVSRGQRCRDGSLRRRRSYRTLSDISSDIIDQEAERLSLSNGNGHALFWPCPTSTPDLQGGAPGMFDGGRVEAWLDVQSFAPSGRSTSCSKAVQTEGGGSHLIGRHIETTNHLPPASLWDDMDVKASSDWMKRRSGVQDGGEAAGCDHAERLLPQQSAASQGPPALLSLLLAAALALLTLAIWFILEPPCHRSNRMPRSFHLVLQYVRGPPPT